MTVRGPGGPRGLLIVSPSNSSVEKLREMSVYLNHLNLKLVLSALCISVFAVGCSDKSPAPAPAPTEKPAPVPPLPEPFGPVVEKQKEPVPAESPAQPAPQPVVKAPEQAQPQPPPQEVKPQEAKPEVQAQQPEPKKEEAQPEPAPEPAPQVEAPKVESPVEKQAEEPPVPVPSEESYESKIKRVSEKLGFEIRVDGYLSGVEIDRGLALLEETVAAVKAFHNTKPIKDEQPVRLEPFFDYVLLSKSTVATSEHEEQMRLQLNANQAKTTAFYNLKFAFARCEPETNGEALSAARLQNCQNSSRVEEVSHFRAAREILNRVRNEVAPFKINCGDDGHYPVLKCALGAKTVQKVLPKIASEKVEQIKEATIHGRTLYNFYSPISFSLTKDLFVRMNVYYYATPKSVADSVNSEWSTISLQSPRK